MDKHTWAVTYTTASNNLITKRFENEEDCIAFTEKLDKRIAKGTCGGYISSRLGDDKSQIKESGESPLKAFRKIIIDD